MPPNDLQKVSPTHEAIARWILANPGPRMVTRCAQYFGYTVPWMSIVINSDAFRAHLGALSDSADAAVIADIPTRLRSTAALALDGLMEQLNMAMEAPSIQHREFIKETADMVLHRLGYAPQKASAPASGTVINNTVVLPVDPATLAAARERFNQLPQAPQPPALTVAAEAAEVVVDGPYAA